jgi:hypothetical protein
MTTDETLAATGRVCSTTRLYHYFLNPSTAIDSVLVQGLVPLSQQKITARGRARVRAWVDRTLRLYFMRRLLLRHVKAHLGQKPTNSGLFLTPIDFRLIPGSLLEGRTRVAVPVEAIEAAQAGIIWVEDEQRIIRPLSPEALEEAAQKWPASAVQEWFNKNPRMMFFYVPQVMTFQGRLTVDQAWIEPGDQQAPSAGPDDPQGTAALSVK